MTIGWPAQNIAIQTPQDVIDPVWYDKLKAVEAALNSLIALQSSLIGAWTPYTPTISATSGTFTSVTTSGRYRQVGKTVSFTAQVNITTVGTAASTVLLGLPVQAAATPFQVVSGRDNGVSGKSLYGFIIGGQSVTRVANYDVTSAIAAGAILTISGTYETS